MKVTSFLCVESAVIDKTTNRLSLFHVLEQINAASFPVPCPKFSVVTVVSRNLNEPNKEELEVRLSLNRKHIVSMPISIDFQKGKLSRFIGELQGLVLPGPGILRASLRHNNRTVNTWDIEILATGKPPELVALEANQAAYKPKRAKAANKPKNNRKD